MPDYQIRIFQLNHYLSVNLPNIFNHFKKQEINADLFLGRWFLTLFSSFLPFEVLCKVWDIFLIVKFFFKFIILHFIG